MLKNLVLYANKVFHECRSILKECKNYAIKGFEVNVLVTLNLLLDFSCFWVQSFHWWEASFRYHKQKHSLSVGLKWLIVENFYGLEVGKEIKVFNFV